jgi:cell division transport system permease protein
MTWLRLHALAIAEALRRLAANPMSNAFSIVVLAVALSLPVLAAMALATVGAATASLDTQPHVNVYLALDATDADAKRVEQALRAQPAVASVRFISRAQALEELKATTHLAEILASFDRNPLPHAFTVRLKTEAGPDIAAIRQAWLALPKVDAVSADFEWAQRLARWVRFGDRLLLLIAAFLAAAVAFIVGHLIRLQVLTRRQEIEVSQLVGATAADVRRPFAYHGILQGLLAGAGAMALASAIGWWLSEEMRALAPAYASELKTVFPGLTLWLTVCLGAAALGLVGASIAVGRELRRFDAAR